MVNKNAAMTAARNNPEALVVVPPAMRPVKLCGEPSKQQSAGQLMHVSLLPHTPSPHITGVGNMVTITIPVAVEQLWLSDGWLDSVSSVWAETAAEESANAASETAKTTIIAAIGFFKKTPYLLFNWNLL